MDDLISRTAAIARIDKCVALSGIGLEPVMAVRDIKALISVLPAVDAAPVVHGRWIHCDGKSHIWYCSNCGEKVNYNNAHKVYAKSTRPIEEVNRFCRNCGAKMDGERRDES